MHDIYLAHQPASDLIRELQPHLECDASTETIQTTWKRNLRYYYGSIVNLVSDNGIGFGGERGELVEMVCNELRTLTRQFISIVTKNRLNFEATAQTSETGVLKDTRLVNSLIKQIVEKQKLDTLGDRLLEHALLTGCGYLHPTWRTDKGKRVARDENGVLIFAGDLQLTAPHPWDIFFDRAQCDFDEREWTIIRTRKNRWDLIAQYPQLEKEIRALPAVDTDDQDVSVLDTGRNEARKDAVFVYEFYHRESPAVEGGRMVVFGSDKAVFFNAENPYKDPEGNAFIPLVPCMPERIIGTPWGYSFVNDLVPLQEILDMCMSTAASNISAYGVQSILNPKGSDISVRNIAGLTLLDYTPQNADGGGKPEPMQKPQTPADVFKFGDVVQQRMMGLANINATLRGAPPSNVTSGDMASILSANAIEFAGPTAKAYNATLEQAMLMCVWIYQRFAKVPQLVSMIGDKKIATVKKFVGDEIGDVAKISLRVSSPIMATAAGVQNAGKQLVQAGLIKNTGEYVELMETGNIEQAYDTELADVELIQAENDDLREGRPVLALATDNQAQHIYQHRTVINDPDLRRLAATPDDGTNPEVTQARAVMKAAQDHILQHLQLAKQTDPMLTAIISTGQQPAPMAPPPGAPMHPTEEE